MPFLTTQQLDALRDLIHTEPTLCIAKTVVHPYSGVVTATGPDEAILINPDGTIAYRR